MQTDNQEKKKKESIEKYGILNPLIVRPVPDGYYEIISGHRRKHAAQLAGLTTIPAIVRKLSDDDATNIQREELLLSEKAFAYKMKMDAMRRTAGRPTKENPRQTATLKIYQAMLKFYMD